MREPEAMRRLIIALSLCAFATPSLAEEVPARLDWWQKITLSTPVSGVVAEVRVAPGQRVKRGDLLARLDERRLHAELEGARAEVKRLKLAFEEAGRELERNRELYERTVIAARDLQLAEIAYAMAEAEYAKARAEVTRLEVDLEQSRLRAPFDAVVIERHIQPGETVANSLSVTPMLTLASSEAMLARAWVDEAVLGRLAVGAQVGVQAGGRRFTGRIERLGLEAREVDGAPRFEIIVRLDPSSTTVLRAGQAATLSLP